MKYFTKDWYVLMQHLHYTTGMTQVPDGEYTDERIAALCKDRMKAYADEQRELYDTPPKRLDINFDELTPEDFAEYDEESGKLKVPATMEEVKAGLERDYAARLKRFEERPPFDARQAIRDFADMYRAKLENAYAGLPDWVKTACDARLIAMDCLPESVYRDLKAEEERNRRLFEAINGAAEDAMKDTPEEIRRQLSFHDGEILEFARRGGDICMLIREDFIPCEGQTPYTRVTFKDAHVTERDERLTFEPLTYEADGQEITGHCTWLYEEIYKTTEGCEVHMLLAENDLCYLTLRCSGIECECDIDYCE